MTEAVKDPRFCYRCGKRVGKSLLNCWYCSAPTARVIRPPRNCPFCQSAISPKAIKCPHCGEFVDGRAPQNPQNLTLNIDKAVFAPGGMQPFGPGQQIPPGQAQYDPSRTFGGQGQSQLPSQQQPYILPAEGPRYLPNPDERQQDAATAGQSGSQLMPYQGQPGQSSAPLAPPTGSSLAFPSATQQPLGFPQQPPQGAMAPYAPAAPQPIPASAPPPEEESRYFICPVCNTEILNTDNYCYYCGQAHSQVKQEGDVRFIGKSNFWFYVAALVLCGIARGIEPLAGLLPQLSDIADYVKIGAMVGAFLLLARAFFRNTKILNRILTILILIAGIFILSL